MLDLVIQSIKAYEAVGTTAQEQNYASAFYPHLFLVALDSNSSVFTDKIRAVNTSVQFALEHPEPVPYAEHLGCSLRMCASMLTAKIWGRDEEAARGGSVTQSSIDVCLQIMGDSRPPRLGPGAVAL